VSKDVFRKNYKIEAIYYWNFGVAKLQKISCVRLNKAVEEVV